MFEERAQGESDVDEPSLLFVPPEPDTRADRAANASVLVKWREIQQAEIELLMELRAWDRSGSWDLDGAHTASHWIADQFGVTHGSAKHMLRLSRRLHDYPAIADAVADGRLSLDKAEVLLAAFTPRRAKHARQWTDQLIADARRLSVENTRTIVRRWNALVDAELDSDPNSPDPDPDTDPPSTLHASETMDGRVEIHGSLNAADGEIVRAALDLARRLNRNQPSEDGPIDSEAGIEPGLEAPSNADVPADDRSAAEQRADAFTLIAQFFLDHHASVTGTSPDRPHIQITVELPVLIGQRGGLGIGRSGLDLNALITGEFACDSAITRIVTAGGSIILDVGRETRVVSTALRKALIIRDRHCRFPGCTMRACFTDAHHVIWWTKGGWTTQENCVLLCRRHHRRCHQGGWTVAGNANKTLTFTAPDGVFYLSNPPP